MGAAMAASMYVAVGGMFSLISVPLIQGKVARNGIYGFRTPKTLSADRIWFPANRYMGRDLFVAGVAIVVGSLMMLVSAPLLGLSGASVALLGTCLMSVCIVVTLVRGFRFLRRL
jgi:uncharacterized membrane protein